MSIIVFDLDDTLYDELSYARSGLLEVSKYMNKQWGTPQEESYAHLLVFLREDRNNILEKILRTYGIFNKKNLRSCISIYRTHQPKILLSKDAKECMERFKDFPLYIVTDGNVTVQSNKIKALNLTEKVKKVFITYRYGVHNSKPSPFCFLKICKLEHVSPDSVWYIGDNPAKDFIGIKPLGFRTIRILQGQHKDVKMGAEYEAELRINSLRELTPELLENK